MFRIRRIFDDVIKRDREAIAQVQDILRKQFSALDNSEIDRLVRKLKNPLKYRFKTVLFIADDKQGRVKGFALVQHEPLMRFCWLDYISINPRDAGRGIGTALYEQVRDEALNLQAEGLFFECLPDDEALCRDTELRRQNMLRLKFYERFEAYPIAGTRYETPFKPADDAPPYLMFDSLGVTAGLSRNRAREIVHAILERKYGRRCPPGYINMVINSFADNPVRLRSPRYCTHSRMHANGPAGFVSLDRRIALVINDRHDIHHVKDRGYVESPVRIKSILDGIQKLGICDELPPHSFPERHIRAVHSRALVDYLKKMCLLIEPGKSLYPYVFPIRNAARPPVEMPVRAGYYCIDTFTPLNRNAFTAARRAVDCALTAAASLFKGYRFAYALVRPPGHHAEKRAFGGFCYFNSAAVAAHFLSATGRVAVLDIDYHHGNGTQNIFYKRRDVLTVSIHGNPKFAYPYFSGFADEKGRDQGRGFNLNIPLEETVDGSRYRTVLNAALERIRRFKPDFLVVALGFDIAKGDPTGTWLLGEQDFELNGNMIGAAGLPTLFIQEGGYRVPLLARNAGSFFRGFANGARTWIAQRSGRTLA
jgi:acetoin utilization deacetylase AcuC-like enzyme/GNAT superfamily N-acetyltransferase